MSTYPQNPHIMWIYTYISLCLYLIVSMCIFVYCFLLELLFTLINILPDLMSVSQSCCFYFATFCSIGQAGWIRGIAAGADNSYCLLGLQPSILLGAVYDLASYQRAFYHELVKINNNLLRPLSKSCMLSPIFSLSCQFFLFLLHVNNDLVFRCVLLFNLDTVNVV